MIVLYVGRCVLINIYIYEVFVYVGTSLWVGGIYMLICLLT